MQEPKSSIVAVLLCFHHIFSLTPVTGQPPSFSDEELRVIATLNLCRHFGGACGAGCERYIVHKWRLPLCANSNHKCCIPDTAYSGAPINTEATTTTTETTPETTTPPVTVSTTTAGQGSTSWVEYPSDNGEAASSAASLDECGSMNRTRRRKRIVGGSVSPPGAWPWLLALRSLIGAHACSGALIAQRWVVTAAHCFKQFASPGLWRMRVGEYNLLTSDENERDIEIANIFIYPGYRSRAPGEDNSTTTLYARYKHDLALVQLAEDARVEPICLPAGEAARVQNSTDSSDQDSQFRMTVLEHSGECWVAGWGFTRDATHDTQVLRQVDGVLVDSEECGDMWGTELEPDMICFGDGTRGPCAGDSGGPLSCWLDGRWYLGGVVSWGTEDCNITGYPSVFTRMAPFMNWVYRTIQQQEQQQ
ncbi:chymotrypsin-like protease CTRL-1 [Pomacea canaliculata]|uniref:chymotrypsin-like protease CTRL-1 n=1 Tax=Pomacea canaliculata TaxID=400727 RepID=UPI000D73AEA1|nr:chymotrypsin-like protease CTRL-1 [Pomacea canaliculata]